MPAKAQRVALVTGGNRGIGLEVVRNILEAGSDHVVFLGCRDMEAGIALAETLRQRYGPRVEALQLDVASADSVTKAASTLRDRTQHLDILVNNAGILLEAEGSEFDLEAIRESIKVNFEGVVAVTEAFMPLLANAPGGEGQILATSSGCGTRTLGLLSEEHRQALLDTTLDLPALRKILWELAEILRDPNSIYRGIPTVGYGISKLGVNCFTQILAREHPTMFINACSPGFCNTDMCGNYTGQRKPKEPALGASVFEKVLFGELGQGRTGTFFKESSKAGTPLDQATSVVDPWVAFP
jgi:NAD(P)-dependent dehydrogenase (short-subunit alcohol dehydrogenase family)